MSFFKTVAMNSPVPVPLNNAYKSMEQTHQMIKGNFSVLKISFRIKMIRNSRSRWWDQRLDPPGSAAAI